MPEVVDCVKKSNADKEMRARMEDRENSQIYLSLIRGSGYKKGKEDGIEESIKSIIKNMISKGKSREEIIDLINISEQEYEKLVN